MIEQIVYADVESNKLLNERNYRNQTPYNLDDQKKFEALFNNIWASAA